MVGGSCILYAFYGLLTKKLIFLVMFKAKNSDDLWLKIGGKGTFGPPIAKKNGNISKKGHYFVSKYARIVIFIKKKVFYSSFIDNLGHHIKMLKLWTSASLVRGSLIHWLIKKLDKVSSPGLFF